MAFLMTALTEGAATAGAAEGAVAAGAETAATAEVAGGAEAAAGGAASRKAAFAGGQTEKTPQQTAGSGSASVKGSPTSGDYVAQNISTGTGLSGEVGG